MEDRLQCTRIIKKDYSQYDHCENRSIEDFFDGDNEISVFYFPGNGGISTKNAKFGCNIIENGLLLEFYNKEEILKHISIYGIFYGLDDSTQYVGEMSKGEVSSFVKNYLLSKCFDKNKKLLTIDKICEKMSKITFVGFCHGQIEICKVIKELRTQLEEKGVTNEDTYKIAKHLFSVCYSPEKMCVECPTVQAYSITDLRQRREGFVSNLFDTYMESLNIKPDGILIDYEKRGEHLGKKVNNTIKNYFDFERIKIFSTKLLNDHTDKLEHSLKWLERDEKWNLKNAYDKNLDCFSQIFFYSIAVGVERGMQIENRKNVGPIDMVDLYKMSCKIERSFSPKDLQDHTK